MFVNTHVQNRVAIDYRFIERNNESWIGNANINERNYNSVLISRWDVFLTGFGACFTTSSFFSQCFFWIRYRTLLIYQNNFHRATVFTLLSSRWFTQNGRTKRSNTDLDKILILFFFFFLKNFDVFIQITIENETNENVWI